MVHRADYAVILVYFLVIGSIGLWNTVRKRHDRTTDQYFVAKRMIPGWAVAFTLMATLISSGTVVGHPATVYQKGMILLLGNAMLLVVLLLVAKWIVPFYRNTVRMSAYEYIGRRFGLGGRMYSSFGFLADRIFDLGVTLLTTSLPIQIMTGLDLRWIILVVGLFTIAYTALGGVEAVVWTDVVQGVILLAAPLVILARLIFAPEAGPPGAVVAEAYRQGRMHLGSFELSWGSLFDTSVTTQWLIILAYSINWGRRYIADQHMVQRYLLARTDREAQSGTMWNALMCVPIWAAFMFVGACLFGFYALSGKPGPELADNIIPYFILHEMPQGLVGAIVAAILAASMSSIAGDLNAVATVLTTDYYSNLLPKSSDRARLAFGRLMVLVAGAIAAGAALLLMPGKGTASIMERGVTIAAILSAGTLGLFFLGFLTRRATRNGCYVGIAACLLFTAWGILTEPTHRLIDLGRFNFGMNPILIGVFGHFILFGVGYIASLALGGYRPEDVEQLTFRWSRPRVEHPPVAPLKS